MFREWQWLGASALIVMMTGFASTVRAQAGGDLDSTFGDGGKVILNLGSAFEEVRAIALQPNGKIVIADEGSGGFIVSRFNSDGSLDTEFGVGGFAFAAVDEQSDVQAVFLDADGGIVVAGQLLTGNLTYLARARFDAAGNLDSTFGDGGVSLSLLAEGVVSPTVTVVFRITSIARLPNGEFVVGGTQQTITSSSSFNSMLAARYEPIGETDLTLDGGFGNAGIAAVEVGPGGADVGAVLFQPDDGKVVLVGAAVIAGNTNVALVRYTLDGDLDPTFGDGGMVFTDVQGNDQANAALLQSDGSILVAGQANGDVALVRYLPDGRRDTTFSGDGKVVTDVSGGFDTAAAVALDRDGKVVVAGSTIVFGSLRGNFLVARYHSNGVLDTTFGNDGIAVTDLRGSDLALAVAIQEDGKIIAAGQADATVSSDFALVRYEPGTTADVTVTKVASLSSVSVGETFTYTLTVTNHGPDAAANVVVRDRIPAGLVFAACAAPGGICGADGDARTISFATIGVGQTRTATLAVSLSPTVVDGASIVNTASVASNSVDPDPGGNVASATILARNVPHTLRLFLHGTDIPGTAGGFTMNATPAPAQAVKLNLVEAPAWFSDPALTGTVVAGGTFRIIRPCTLGLTLGATYSLAATDPVGGSAQILGQTNRLLAPCIGQEVVSIPIVTPVTFSNQRLRLTISSSVSTNLDLQLGEGTRFEITNFAGLP